MSPDVAVIGGGIVGVATAAHLAEGGSQVILYEREAIAAGASGRNSGVVQHPFDPALVGMYEETLDVYRRLAIELPEAGFRLAGEPAGLLLVSRHAGVVGPLARRIGALFPHLAPTVFENGDLRAIEPAIGPGVSACRVPIGYPVVPSAPTYALATLAERRGVTIRQGRSASPVTERGRCTGVRVDGRFEPAGAVVVAAGPWTPGIIDPSGAWSPIRPLWGVVVETVLAEPPGHVLEEAEMDAALGTGDVAAEAGVEVGDPATTPEFSLVSAAGMSSVGSTFLEAEPDPSAWTERILRRATAFVPALLEAPIRDVRACARPVALDGRPLVGPVPGIDGLFVCAGHGPWGISIGPGSARLVADLVLGRAIDIPAALDPARFGAPGSARHLAFPAGN